MDRIFRIQDAARRHILVGYLLGAQAVGSDVSPDLVHRGTFDDGIASNAKEGKFHGGTFPIWRYAQPKTSFGSVPFLFQSLGGVGEGDGGGGPEEGANARAPNAYFPQFLALMLGRMIGMITGFGATASSP